MATFSLRRTAPNPEIVVLVVFTSGDRMPWRRTYRSEPYDSATGRLSSKKKVPQEQHVTENNRFDVGLG